ncbi:hypothetical protein RP20_CCG006479 [Aedes albopictus]|nr:hypothetical protein RP20_CCG006479 [Aedes albopictus]
MQTTDPGGNGQGPTAAANNNYNSKTAPPKPPPPRLTTPPPRPPPRSWTDVKGSILRWRGSRRLVLVIVAIALLLDNMLLTVVGKYLTRVGGSRG